MDYSHLFCFQMPLFKEGYLNANLYEILLAFSLLGFFINNHA